MIEKPKKVEAKSEKMDRKTNQILGVTISGNNKQGLLRKITSIIDNKAHTKPFFIITAYSENVMEIEYDQQLADAFSEASLIVPDGVGVLAGLDYIGNRTGRIERDLALGVEVGLRVLRGQYSQKKIVGVRLAQDLLDLADNNKWKVYLLGGWPGMGQKIANRHKSVIGYDVGYQNIKMQKNDIRFNNEIVRKINNKRPDILLVGLGRFEQEKWIARNLDKLMIKVVMGIGSGFDEMTGGFGVWKNNSPEWVERMGLKWLWRGLKDPNNIRRAWNAFPVFAWKVFRSPI